MIDGGLRKLFQKHLPMIHWQPIETGQIASGVPDMNFCHDAVEGWIEFKAAEPHERIGFRPMQIGWIKERLRQRGRVFVAVKSVLPSMMVMFYGSVVEDWESSVQDNIHHSLGVWIGRPQDWDWQQILYHLIKESK